MQQLQQQAFAPAQPAVPLQAPGSQGPQAAQASQPPLPSHNQSGSPPAQSHSGGPPSNATAAPVAVQAPAASQAASPSPSDMSQPEGPTAGGPSMAAAAAQAGKAAHDRGGAHQLSVHGDNAQQTMYSSKPNPGMGYSGSASPTPTVNGLRPEQVLGPSVSGAHESSNGSQVVHSTSAALAQPAQPGPTQSSSAATGASVNAAAGGGEGGSEKQQQDRYGDAGELLDKAQLHVPSGGFDKAAGAARDATSTAMHQSEFARGDVSEAGNMEDGLIESQILAGGMQAMSQNLLAD